MNTKRALAQRAWLGVIAGAGLLQFAAPVMAGTCTAPNAKINMSTVTVPDYVQVSGGGWALNSVTLNGQSSQPNPNQGGQYQWSFVGAHIGTLTNANTPQATFTAADVTTSKQVTLRLTVTVAGCSGSDSQDITLTVTNAHDVAANTAPHAIAVASPTSATEGTTVTLDGSASWDAEPGALTYAWVQTSGAPVTLVATANPAIKTFVAPDLATASQLAFRLTVTDGGGLQNTADAFVSISWTNNAPVAALQCPGGVMDVNEGAQVTLDGRASTDSDDGIASYAWQQLSGLPEVPGAVGWTTPLVTFTAPSLGYQQTGLVPMQLTVTDRSGAKSTAQCAVFIHDVTRPVITVPTGSPSTAEATSAAGANVAYIASALDAVDGSLPIGSQNFICTPPAGSLFALDALSPVVCNAKDSAGNTAQATFSIKVVDTTPPVIPAPQSIGVEATSPAGAVATFDIKSNDLVDGQQPATCAPASGSTFAINAPGPTTTVSCGATDAHGNAATPVTFNVDVHDTKAPVFDAATVSPDLLLEATSAGGAVATFASPSASDLVDLGNVAVSCAPASGSTFAITDTTVRCDAADTRHNTTGGASSATFHVRVQDTLAPVFSNVPSNQLLEATSAAGAAFAYVAPTANDIVDGARAVACAPGSGTFPLGSTTVTCSSSDSRSNTATASFQVEVQDTTAPSLIVPANQTAEASGPSGAQVAFAAFANDLVDGPVSPTCTMESGATFPIGTTTVTCTATDAHHNVATGSFDVLVRDTTPPLLTVPLLAAVEATGATGAAVTFDVSAIDTVDGDVVPVCSAASGSTFKLGTTTVTCTATDAHGNANSDHFDVVVVDTTAPVLTVPATQTREATGPSGAAVTFAATATDIVDGSVSPVCTPASGSTFALGTATVTCTATDAAGNSSSDTFSVHVQDTTAPVLSLPTPAATEATGASGAIVTFNASALDLVDGGVMPVCTSASGATFPIGTTTVSCTAKDAAGNEASGQFNVVVRDTTRPNLTLPGNRTVEATGPAGAGVTFTASASDIVDGNVVPMCIPASGSTFGLGITAVICNATDAHANTASGSFNVDVVDTTGPAITAHADVTVKATANSSALVQYTLPTATDLVDGAVAVSCLPASGSSFPVGSTTVNCSATDSRGNKSTSNFAVTVGYDFNGFFQPVDMAPAVNSVKAGSAVPVKFALGGNQGLAIFAANSPSATVVNCSSSAEMAIEETVTAGNSSLQYDSAANQYIYVWKTDKSWVGQCRVLTVKLKDGSVKSAQFKFK